VLKKLSFAAGAAAIIVFAAPSARAYCRTSTCSAPGSSADCAQDERGCAIGGKPLAWKQSCVSFSVHEAGLAALGLRHEALSDLVSQAFAVWTAVDCGGVRPSINLEPTPRPALCGRPEHNSDQANANVWMVDGSSWPYQKNALAVTTVTFDDESGAILDADVELNGEGPELSVGDAGVQYDLASVIQHESGHFLGLAHSEVREATMWARLLRGTTEGRSLHADDVAAICASYPADRPVGVCDFRPRNGWSAECANDDGCGVARAPVTAPSLWLVALGALVVRACRRVRRRAD
jgi:hypothetical protein